MKKIAMLILLASALSACATAHQELKAPCSPLDCKNRVPVNSWVAE
jgi:hypothetical protein